MRSLIGLAMRLYRVSPLYPGFGKLFARVLSWVPRSKTPVQTDVNGVRFELDLREVIDSSLYYSGSFEPLAEQVIDGAVRPGMTAIDIGANIGYHTFSLARLVGSTGTVVAVEPTMYAFDKLARNARLNDFFNLRLMRAGLSNTDHGEIEARFRSSYRLDGRDEVRTELVRVLTLDTLVRESGLARVDFIKMDVDGFEGKVLTGARWVLERFRPTIFFEFFPRGMREVGDDPQELLQMLWDLGYSLRSEAGVETPDADSVMRAIYSGEGSTNLLATPPSAERLAEEPLRRLPQVGSPLEIHDHPPGRREAA